MPFEKYRTFDVCIAKPHGRIAKPHGRIAKPHGRIAKPHGRIAETARSYFRNPHGGGYYLSSESVPRCQLGTVMMLKVGVDTI